MSLLIRNGRIITADQDYCADIYIEKDKITTIGENLEMQADRVIDAVGKYVIPGGVDVHTHLDMPYSNTVSSDDFETGTRAAAFGGTTSIIDFAIQYRGTRMREALETALAKAQKATVDYGLHMILTDVPEARLEDMNEMVHEGVTSFKMFMAYPDVLMADDRTIFRVMCHAARNGGLVCIHAENGMAIEILVQKALAEGKTAPIHHALTRPVTAEAEAVNRAIALAQMAGGPLYIVHLSSADAMERVAEARGRGQLVFAETCPQYLLLSIDDLNQPVSEAAKYVFTPPPREKCHQDRLWDGLRSNVLQAVSTDHCPVYWKDKIKYASDCFAKIPNGGPGIENRLQLIHHFGVNAGRISLNCWVDIISTAPARLFGLYPRKGALAAGSDADIVVWNPELDLTISARTHHMRVDYSMFENFRVRGNAETVLSRGEILVEKGKWFGSTGRGEFIRRAAFSGKEDQGISRPGPAN